MDRIAIVCGAGLLSGKESMALELAKGLREVGHEVEIVTSAWGDGAFRKRCADMGLRTHSMRLGFISMKLKFEYLRMTGHQLLHWPGLLARYARFLKRQKPAKVVHTDLHHVLLLLPLLSAKRDVYWVHDIFADKPHYRRIFRWFERRLRAFVPVSNAVAFSLEKLHVAPEKIHVIHNGITDPISETRARPRLDFPVVGIVGQIGPWKGHEDLLEAFVMLGASFGNAKLHIFGEGDFDYKKMLKEKITALRMMDRVIWRGFVSNRAEIYNTMDICVVPSRFEEPLSTVAIEAAFFGVPVVATRQGGSAEIIEDSRTGFLVDAQQPAQLASRLERLLADDQLRHDIGKNARLRARERFDRKRFVQDFVRLLESN